MRLGKSNKDNLNKLLRSLSIFIPAGTAFILLIDKSGNLNLNTFLLIITFLMLGTMWDTSIKILTDDVIRLKERIWDLEHDKNDSINEDRNGESKH